jgi:hypothetical protein
VWVATRALLLLEVGAGCAQEDSKPVLLLIQDDMSAIRLAAVSLTLATVSAVNCTVASASCLALPSSCWYMLGVACRRVVSTTIQSEKLGESKQKEKSTALKELLRGSE